jgi:hypothetical protein
MEYPQNRRFEGSLGFESVGPFVPGVVDDGIKSVHHPTFHLLDKTLPVPFSPSGTLIFREMFCSGESFLPSPITVILGYFPWRATLDDFHIGAGGSIWGNEGYLVTKFG